MSNKLLSVIFGAAFAALALSPSAFAEGQELAEMHAEMDEYNERGITFRYLAYPRAGIKDQLGNFTDGYKDLRSVWCNDDSAGALTRAKAGSGIAYRICETPIEGQFDFGRQIGVTGTPAIILPNGMMVPGYQPAAQLEALLKNIKQS